MCRRIATIFLVLVVLLALGLGYAWYDLTRRAPTLPASVAAPPRKDPPTPTEQKAATATVRRLEKQLKPSPPATPDAPPPSVELRVTESEVNELIRSLPAAQQALDRAKLREAAVAFEPGRVIAGARVPLMRGVEARVAAVGQIKAEGGRLVYRTESVHLGSFPAPAPVRAALDKQLSQAIEQLNRNLKGTVDAVEITDDALVVRGTPDPPRRRRTAPAPAELPPAPSELAPIPSESAPAPSEAAPTPPATPDGPPTDTTGANH